MAHSFDIRFDDTPTIDDVTLALAPIDAFTGRIVPAGVKAEIENLPDVQIRNLSGMLVFTNLPAQPMYRIIVTAKRAGYFDPATVQFVPPASDDPDWARKRRLDVLLYRRPTAPIEADATTVAGIVVRGVQAVTGARVWAELPANLLPPGAPPLREFETRSDERGAFALSLRLPADAITGTVDVKFKFSEGADQREIERPVSERKFYSFEEAIDLGGANTPQLLPFGG